MTGMSLDATMTPAHWVILVGIVALCGAGTITLTVYGRWLIGLGLAADPCLPECADVNEAELSLPELRDTYLGETA